MALGEPGAGARFPPDHPSMLLVFVEMSFLSQNLTLTSAFAVQTPLFPLYSKGLFCGLANPLYKWMEEKNHPSAECLL